jgi:hypothetical protein
MQLTNPLILCREVFVRLSANPLKKLGKHYEHDKKIILIFIMKTNYLYIKSDHLQDSSTEHQNYAAKLWVIFSTAYIKI